MDVLYVFFCRDELFDANGNTLTPNEILTTAILDDEGFDFDVRKCLCQTVLKLSIVV